MPGICTSSVMTSGFNCLTFFFASMALTAKPTTSMPGYLLRPSIITFRAKIESSTTNVLIFPAMPYRLLSLFDSLYFRKMEVVMRLYGASGGRVSDKLIIKYPPGTVAS